jgi:hypothetical protein
MPYKFTFDLSKIPRFFFTEIAKAGYRKGMHKKMGQAADKMIRKFKIQETTGLDLSDAVVLLEDLIAYRLEISSTEKNLLKQRKGYCSCRIALENSWTVAVVQFLTLIFHLTSVPIVLRTVWLARQFF